jgi:hypothetical protein
MPRYDPAKRRQGIRKGAERGAWIYIPAEELKAAGIDVASEPPYYRLWPGNNNKRNILVQFYAER